MGSPAIDEKQNRWAELVALQARMLLYYEGAAGTLTIRREADGRRRIEVEFDGQEKYSARGGLLLIGQTLASVGTQFHRLEELT